MAEEEHFDLQLVTIDKMSKSGVCGRNIRLTTTIPELQVIKKTIVLLLINLPIYLKTESIDENFTFNLLENLYFIQVALEQPRGRPPEDKSNNSGTVDPIHYNPGDYVRGTLATDFPNKTLHTCGQCKSHIQNKFS